MKTPIYKIGQYVETTYSNQVFRGFITSIDKGRYIMTPDEGVVLSHSRFTRHGDHICTTNKIKLINRITLPDELFEL